ncbi:MAG: UDP-glucose/GDP-mannose dehydrogenase dimerization [Parcubacteria group bacterium Greene1014_15]|nr:MAG: UDP-glucose/GDP-mannose dehydrogenase dimerization [Parcubacteria group bacterium Greene1014_15]
MTHKKIGFIGQGWIGKNYANDFEQRGFSVVRYAKEPEYAGTRKDIATCDIVFIAVPTPTTEAGFDDSIVRAVLPLIGKGKTAVIKSTILPGTTESIQKQFPDVFVFHSPEFLTEATAVPNGILSVFRIIRMRRERKHRKCSTCCPLRRLRPYAHRAKRS